MRWKLLLIASLLATVLGAGLTLLLIFMLANRGAWLVPGGLFYVLATLFFPLASITFAAIFVYRHTARRRPVQAVLTALISILLTLTVLLAASMLLGKAAPAFPPLPSQRNVG